MNDFSHAEKRRKCLSQEAFEEFLGRYQRLRVLELNSYAIHYSIGFQNLLQLAQLQHGLRSLQLASLLNLDSDVLPSLLQNNPGLTTLNLDYTQIRDEDLALLQTFRLASVSLQKCSLSKSALKAFFSS